MINDYQADDFLNINPALGLYIYIYIISLARVENKVYERKDRKIYMKLFYNARRDEIDISIPMYRHNYIRFIHFFFSFFFFFFFGKSS